MQASYMKTSAELKCQMCKYHKQINGMHFVQQKLSKQKD